MSRRNTGEVEFPYQNIVYNCEQGVIAKPPEGVLRPGGLRLTKRLIEACAFARGAKVVDVGCGTGITVEYLREVCGFDAMGVDISEARLQQGRVRSAGLPLIRAAGQALPFASNSCDGVLAECSLSVMEDVGRVVAEINRILVPGGKLAVTDLYVRTGCALPAACAAKAGGIKTGDQLATMLSELGFHMILWEDQSVYLKEFVARFIMEHGSVEELWQCLAKRQQNQQLLRRAPKNGLGYYLLVAQKCQADVKIDW